ncbi:IS66 family transposase zinc-finger binding domain-containing protein [Enterocloster clostridioformis]|uniref:IS66 family transposase zinc-finger binding domain-containing protein n=1 Tax=Enterocloster clostridioformis TaxID=1531 RepID=UPI0009B7DA99
MEVIGKKVVREELRIIPAKVERIQYVQEVLGCPYARKCLRHLNSPSPSFMRGIRACFLRHFIP